MARNYDDDTLDELVVEADGVVVPTGGGVWIPVRRRRLSDRGGPEQSLFRVEDSVPSVPDGSLPLPITSSEIAVPLLDGPEVVTGIWPVDADKGMVVVVNPDGGDYPLSDGDRVAAVMPAAIQTRTCRACGMVDTDGFVSDVVMCDTCGTLVAKGPSPCAGCGAGPDRRWPMPCPCVSRAGCMRCVAAQLELCGGRREPWRALCPGPWRYA